MLLLDIRFRVYYVIREYLVADEASRLAVSVTWRIALITCEQQPQAARGSCSSVGRGIEFEPHSNDHWGKGQGQTILIDIPKHEYYALKHKYHSRLGRQLRLVALMSFTMLLRGA